MQHNVGHDLRPLTSSSCGSVLSRSAQKFDAFSMSRMFLGSMPIMYCSQDEEGRPVPAQGATF